MCHSITCTPKHSGLRACDHESDYRVLARSQNEGALEHSNNKAVCRPLSNFRSNKNIKVLKTSREVKNGQLHHAMLAHNKEHQADWLETGIRVWESHTVIIAIGFPHHIIVFYIKSIINELRCTLCSPFAVTTEEQ